jgi:lysophospholipase L1-like esterase
MTMKLAWRVADPAIKTAWRNPLGAMEYNVPALPSGAVGIWYADQYDTGFIPNAASAQPRSPNLISSETGLQTTFWPSSGGTQTDGQTAYDGSTDAVRYSGTGAWFLFPSNPFPSGSYVIALYGKSNSGSQNYEIGFYGSTLVQKTFTSTFQRIVAQVTAVAGQQPYIGAIAGAAHDLTISHIAIYPGTADLGPTAPVGHMYFGSTQYSGQPLRDGVAINHSNSAYGRVQFPADIALSAFTVVALGKKFTEASDYNAMLSDIHSYATFSSWFDQSADHGRRTFAFAGFNGAPLGRAKLLGTPYHFYANRSDGTVSDAFTDDIISGSYTGATGSTSVRDLFVGSTNGTLGTDFAWSVMAFFNRALTNKEVLDAREILIDRMQGHGLTHSTTSVYVSEGDSLSAQTYGNLFVPNATTSLIYRNNAVGGSTMATLNSRAAALDALLPANRGTRKFILSVMIGANDLNIGYSGGASGYATDLAAYCDARRAAGWIVIVGTLLPRIGVTNWSTLRATVNAAIATWVGVHCNGVADFASEPTYGPDAAASDTAKYPDGLHPVAAGYTAMEVVIRPVINGLL